MVDGVQPAVLEQQRALADAFAHARPFRHVVIDDFVKPELCTALVEAFPPFDQTAATNENGLVGRKAVHDRPAQIGPPYVKLDALVASAPFRQLISTITGISDLRYDPHYFGGGTHENLSGQDLDPHVDFNRHPLTDQHRRLNLILFLNPVWKPQWGGALELHRNPRAATSDDEIVTIQPTLNRLVIFETTEHSWHGFRRVDLPDDAPTDSRKSFALYYYTRTRPAAELAPEHSTIYVDRPLPEHLQPGYQLTEEDCAALRDTLTRRDDHIKRLYARIMTLENSRVMRWLAPLRRLRARLRSGS